MIAPEIIECGLDGGIREVAGGKRQPQGLILARERGPGGQTAYADRGAVLVLVHIEQHVYAGVPVTGHRVGDFSKIILIDDTGCRHQSIEEEDQADTVEALVGQLARCFRVG